MVSPSDSNGGHLAPVPVIIDTDPAIGIPLHDVDDALAILYMLAMPAEFKVVGLTTVFGNTSLANTTAKAREVLQVAGRSRIPVRPGARRRADLGKETGASRFIASFAREHPGKLTVLAIGPLTNVATAGILDKGFYENVGRIVVMGGALESGYGLPLISPMELNFLKDTRAAAGVLSAPCEKVVVTAELCRQVVFSRREIDALASIPGAAARYLVRSIEPWYRVNRIAPVPWKGGFVPWDVVAAAHLCRPELFEERETCLRLRKGLFRTGGIEPCDDGSTMCRLPVTVEAAALLDGFCDRIASLER
jgi:purine nucleosidase